MFKLMKKDPAALASLVCPILMKFLAGAQGVQLQRRMDCKCFSGIVGQLRGHREHAKKDEGTAHVDAHKPDPGEAQDTHSSADDNVSATVGSAGFQETAALDPPSWEVPFLNVERRKLSIFIFP